MTRWQIHLTRFSHYWAENPKTRVSSRPLRVRDEFS
jgi:hypothetical protein